MRNLRRNKQKLYYALLVGEVPIYELDENGNKIVDYVTEEGEVIYRETGESKIAYGSPVEFWGNISMSGGESQAVEFGLDVSAYSAVLVAEKGLLPINETSRIWHVTEPEINPDGTSNQYSADYTVVKLSPSLNADKYVLAKVVK